jgi:quinol monooxygenase YgiN
MNSPLKTQTTKTHPRQENHDQDALRRIHRQAGSEARVAEMMRELTEQVRSEPGNQLFLPYTRESNPREYFVFEVYRG